MVVAHRRLCRGQGRASGHRPSSSRCSRAASMSLSRRRSGSACQATRVVRPRRPARRARARTRLAVEHVRGSQFGDRHSAGGVTERGGAHVTKASRMSSVSSRRVVVRSRCSPHQLVAARCLLLSACCSPPLAAVEPVVQHVGQLQAPLPKVSTSLGCWISPMPQTHISTPGMRAVVLVEHLLIHRADEIRDTGPAWTSDARRMVIAVLRRVARR